MTLANGDIVSGLLAERRCLAVSTTQCAQRKMDEFASGLEVVLDNLGNANSAPALIGLLRMRSVSGDNQGFDYLP